MAGLPATRTSFVGRDGVLASVLAALDGSSVVSLVGPGGVGKTRLAAKAAELAAPAYPSGAAFADLVPVRRDSSASRWPHSSASPKAPAGRWMRP